MPDAGMNIHVAPERQSVVIEPASAGLPLGRLELNLDDLDRLIGALGQARSELVKGRPGPDFETATISAAANPVWCVKASPPTGALLAFDHPKFEPVGFVLPRDQITTIVTFLTQRFILQKAPSGKH